MNKKNRNKSFYKFIFFLIQFSYKITLAAKLSLGIYISNYNNGFSEIPSVKNDTAVINLFLKQQGFENNIMLVNEKATKSNILNEIKNLTKKSKKGDQVIIFFDGHGCQINDDFSNNKDEPDLLDECFVPFDAIGFDKVTSKETSNSYLSDDELSLALSVLADTIGINGSIYVFYDCCHSGSMAKGEIDETSFNFQKTIPNLNLSYSDSETFKSKKNSACINYFSAAASAIPSIPKRINDVSYGNLALSLFNIYQFENLNGISNDDFFSLIKNSYFKYSINSNYPQFESTCKESPFLNGNVIPKDEFYRILKIDDKDNHKILVNIPSIGLIDTGSTFGILPVNADKYDKNKLVAIAKLKFSMSTTSELFCDTQISNLSYKVFPINIKSKKNPLTIYSNNKIISEKIQNKFEYNVKLVTSQNESNLAGIVNGKILYIINNNLNQTFDSLDMNCINFDESLFKVINRFQIFCNLLNSEKANLKTSDINVEGNIREENNSNSNDIKTNTIDIKPNKTYVLELNNNSNYDYKYSVAYLTSNGDFTIQIPSNSNPNDRIIESGKVEKILNFNYDTTQCSNLVEYILIYYTYKIDNSAFSYDIVSVAEQFKKYKTSFTDCNLTLAANNERQSPKGASDVILKIDIIPLRCLKK